MEPSSRTTTSALVPSISGPMARVTSQFSGGTVESVQSLINRDALLDLISLYPCIDRYEPVAPLPSQRAHLPPVGKVAVYFHWFSISNFRLPPTPFLISLLEYYGIGFSQLHPLSLQKIIMFEVYCRLHRKEPSLLYFSSQFSLTNSPESWFSVAKRSGRFANFCGPRADGLRGWKERFFFVDVSIFPLNKPGLLRWVNPQDWVNRLAPVKNAPPENLDSDPVVDADFLRLLRHGGVVM